MRLGYRKKDLMSGLLTVDEMASIVVAAQRGSAVYHALNEDWYPADHLLATISEQQANLITLTKRYERPGVTDSRPAEPPDINDHDAPVQKIVLDTMTIEQYEERRRAHLGG